MYIKRMGDSLGNWLMVVIPFLLMGCGHLKMMCQQQMQINYFLRQDLKRNRMECSAFWKKDISLFPIKQATENKKTLSASFRFFISVGTVSFQDRKSTRL